MMDRWQVVVITPERVIEGEGDAIMRLIDGGADWIHLRHPDASKEEMMAVLRGVKSEYLSRISIHDHHDIAEEIAVGCLHVNGRNPMPCREMMQRCAAAVKVSRSCHSIAELESASEFDHVFLSPIFDSISKRGYSSAFAADELIEAKGRGLISSHVIALGGICEANVRIAKEYGFGGVALLGAVWQGVSKASDIDDSIISRYKEI